MGESSSRVVGLGARVRQLRAAQDLSLRALAARSGFSPSFISQLEADQVSPSLPSLQRIAHALGVTLSRFFSALEAPPRRLVRRGERGVYHSDWSRTVAEALTDGAPERQLAAFQLTVDPGGRSGSRPAPGRQDTLLVLLAGALVVTGPAEETPLTGGDAAYIAAGEPFGWENRADNPATLLLVEAAGGAGLVTDLLRDVGA